MQEPVSLVIRSIDFRWDRARNMLWVDIGTETGGQWSVGFPVLYIAESIAHELSQLGVQAQPEVGEDFASVDGFGSWLKRTTRKASRAVKKATKKVTRKVTRAAGRAIKTAYRRGVPKFARKGISQAGRLAKRYGATALQAAGTGASFVPGLGTGVAAGLGTAAALARGRSLAQAARAGAMSGRRRRCGNCSVDSSRPGPRHAGRGRGGPRCSSADRVSAALHPPRWRPRRWSARDAGQWPGGGFQRAKWFEGRQARCGCTGRLSRPGMPREGGGGCAAR